MARFLAISCEALVRTVYAVAATTPHTVNVQTLEQGLHNHPRNLRITLQDQIDSVEQGLYQAILLAYGMCGMSTIGLIARHTPLVIPRAHDCITLYLGSHERYQEEFEKHPGTYWYSVDYLEHMRGENIVALGAAGLEEEEAQYDKYVLKWGKETADLLMEEIRGWTKHYTRAAFIDTGLGDTARFEKIAQDKAQQEGWVYERKQGNRRLLEMLLNGDWSKDEFLTVQPSYKIRQSPNGLIQAELA